MDSKRIWSLVAASALMAAGGSVSVQAASDCRLAERYISLARERQAAAETLEAESLLKQAIEACPSYEALQSLGELQAQSTKRADQAHAVDSFVSADELAPTDRDRARTRFQYANLLRRDGDTQNAYQLIHDAQRLDPKDPEIAQLSSQIERQIQNPSQERIMRGAGPSLYKPLRTVATGTDAGIHAGAAAPPPAH